MRSKRRSTNLRILQSELQKVAISEEPELSKEPMKGSGATIRSTPDELPIQTKLKKKGIPKDELINTKRLLTM